MNIDTYICIIFSNKQQSQITIETKVHYNDPNKLLDTILYFMN